MVAGVGVSEASDMERVPSTGGGSDIARICARGQSALSLERANGWHLKAGITTAVCCARYNHHYGALQPTYCTAQ
jgi:hypothetical protein